MPKCPNCKDGVLSGKERKRTGYGKVSYRGSVLHCNICEHKEVF